MMAIVVTDIVVTDIAMRGVVVVQDAATEWFLTRQQYWSVWRYCHMIGIRQFLFLLCASVALWVALFFCCSSGVAAQPVAGAEQALLAKYPSIKTKLAHNQFGAPIYLESAETDSAVRVDMYGILNQPFQVVSHTLHAPANWCDITSLHINIKACTLKKSSGQPLLTLYSGRKFYQPPADTYPLKLKFHLVSQQPKYLEIALAADEGPLRTKDHRIRLQATPLDSRRTLVHFSYSYSQGPVARMAIKSYFSTIARDKVGFSTVVGKGGKPQLVHGVRGAIERNTVRYYLALQIYIDTLKYPPAQRFEQRISRWYDLTARYPRQLKEVEKSEYLANKRLERNDQVMLQNKEGR